jgi:hypothetical protein
MSKSENNSRKMFQVKMERLMEAAGDCVKLGRICNLMRLHQAHYKVVCFTPEGFGSRRRQSANGCVRNHL